VKYTQTSFTPIGVGTCFSLMRSSVVFALMFITIESLITIFGFKNTTR
jgi:high-affinity nickel permease